MQDPAGFALLKASPNVFGAIQTSCKERSLNIKFISGQWIIDSLLRIWGGFRTLSNSRRRIQSNVWSIRKLQSTKCRTHVESYDSMTMSKHPVSLSVNFSRTCGTFNPSKISSMTEFQTCRGALWELPKPRNVASHVWETNSCCVGVAISQTAVLHNKSSYCQSQRFFVFDVFRCGKLSCTATWIRFNQSWAWKSIINHPSFVYSFVRSFFACNTCTKLGSIVNSRSKLRANKNNNPAGQRQLQYSGNVPKR